LLVSWTVLTVWRTAQPAETAAGTGGRASDILVKTPGARSSIHYLGTLTGFSLHSNFGALPFHDAINEKLKRSGPHRYLHQSS